MDRANRDSHLDGVLIGFDANTQRQLCHLLQDRHFDHELALARPISATKAGDMKSLDGWPAWCTTTSNHVAKPTECWP